MKLVIGPTIAIHNLGYVSSESAIGLPFRPDDPHTFIFLRGNIVEFLDVTAEKSHESLQQAVSSIFVLRPILLNVRPLILQVGIGGGKAI